MRRFASHGGRERESENLDLGELQWSWKNVEEVIVAGW